MNRKSAKETISRLADDAAAITTVCLLFIAPLFMGGRHGLGVWVYVLATIPAAISLCAKAHLGSLRLPPKLILGVLVAIVIIPLAQSMTIPAELVSMFAPGVERLSIKDSDQTWPNTLGDSFSIVPSVSKQCLPIALAYVIAFLNFFGSINSTADSRLLLRLIVVSIATIAGLALLQVSGLGNEKFMWLYDHPTRDPGNIPRGPFQNENHLCSLIAIAVPIAIGFVLRPFIRATNGFLTRSRRDKRAEGVDLDQLVSGIALIIFCVTVYATPSRGGAALVVSGTVVLGALVFWAYLCKHHLARWIPNGQLLGWAVFGVIFIASITALFTQVHRFSYWRYKIYSSNIDMLKDFPISGIGVGTHRHVYRAYLDEYFPQTFTHAESSIIQIASETGAVGCLLLVLVLAIIVRAGWKMINKQSISSDSLLHYSVLAALLVSLLHACFDFNWHIPACLVPVLALAAVVVRTIECETQTVETDKFEIARYSPRNLLEPKKIAVLGLCLMLFLAAFTQSKLAKADLAWDEYRRICRDDDLSKLPEQQIYRSMMALRDCLRSDPMHVLAHVRLAQSYLKMASSLPVREREQALAVTQLLAQNAARISPTQSEPPWLFAEAEIMRTGDLLTQKGLLRHAVKLRPTDGRGLGRLALIAQIEGQPGQAEVYWRIALKHDPSTYQQTLTQLQLFESVSSILSKYQPTLSAAEILFELVNGDSNNSEQSESLRRYLAAKYEALAVEDPSDTIAEHYYSRAFHYLSRTKQTNAIIQLLETRVERNPQLIENRLVLVQYLIERGAFERSEHHLAICRRIDPRNERLGQLLIASQRRMVDHPGNRTERR